MTQNLISEIQALLDKAAGESAKPKAIEQSAQPSMDLRDYEIFEKHGKKFVPGSLVKIISVTHSGGMGKWLLFCQTDNPKQPRRTVKANLLPPEARAASKPIPAQASLPDDPLLPVTALAAVNLNRLDALALGQSNAGWYQDLWGKGVGACLAAVKPALLASPFPASTGDNYGLKIFHLRKLFTSLAPAPVVSVAPPAPSLAETLEAVKAAEDYETEFRADPKLQSEFGSAKFYAAFKRSVVAGQRHRNYLHGTAKPQTASESAAVETLIAARKYKEAWILSPKLQSEFASADQFQAYMRHRGNDITGNREAFNKAVEAAAPAGHVAALIAAGKYEEAFAADATIRAEFGKANFFAAYQRGAAAGFIKSPVRD